MNYCKTILLAVGVIILAVSCKKKDILPEEIGEQVPFTPEASRNWQEVMNDAEFSLFKAAYDRSVVATRIKNTNAAFHTIFMPVNSAFENAGWTLDKINSTTPQNLDSLLAFYMVTGQYKKEGMQLPMPRSYMLNSLLIDPRRSNYVYRMYIGSWNDSLTINGKVVGTFERSEQALNGYVYKINKMVELPRLTLIEYIRSQPRFSMLLEAITTSATYYRSPVTSNNPQFITKLGQTTTARHTLFLPTNRAFANSGIHTNADVIRLIDNSLPINRPDYDEEDRYQYPSTAMDSLLRAHGFAALTSNPLDAIYYYKDLVKAGPQLTGFVLHPSSRFQSKKTIIETTIASANNQVRVGSFRKPGTFQPIVEADIECLNGIIHVVDDSLMQP